MDKAITHTTNNQDNYVSNHVMEPGPLSDRKLSGTWKDYISVTKVGIILGNLLTVLAGMWLASITILNQPLNFSLTVITLLGTSFIIASGTCLNNYIDRDIDQRMSRTKNRALPEGRLNPNNVLLMGWILAILGTVTLVYVNVLTAIVALIGLFFYVVIYTLWLKRTHHINTVVGGIAGAMPPLIGWAAVTGSLEFGAWILFAILFVWQPPHFLALAMKRVDDYRAAGIPMLPVVRGFAETKRQIFIYTVVLLPMSLLLVMHSAVGVAYLVLASILGLIWIVLSGSGFYTNNDLKWAKYNFTFSLIYLTLLCVGIIIFTL